MSHVEAPAPAERAGPALFIADVRIGYWPRFGKLSKPLACDLLANRLAGQAEKGASQYEAT
jgi:hypothetical protein